MAKIAIGSIHEVTKPDLIQALIVEFIATFLFIFAGVGSAMATEKLVGDEVVGLFFVAMTHAFVVAVMISAAFRISGGHLNPAVTLGLCVGGHITVVRSILYWIDQLLASVAACALLSYLTNGLVMPVHTLAAGMDSLQGVIMEIVLTFSLLFTVYATLVDPKKGFLDGLGPLLVGLLVGSNIMAAGSFSGASMNPARSFGPALVAGDWTDHWVSGRSTDWWRTRWFIYENFFIVRTHVPIAHDEF